MIGSDFAMAFHCEGKRMEIMVYKPILNRSRKRIGFSMIYTVPLNNKKKRAFFELFMKEGLKRLKVK